jgi:Xaa-Pro aminopeptidase
VEISPDPFYEDVMANKRSAVSCSLALAAMVLLFHGIAHGQRTGYSTEEFQARREALMKTAGDGLIVLFGEAVKPQGTHFRQDNDFYYFSGSEDVNAILVMMPRTLETHLFLPQQTPREKMIDGANLLERPDAAKKAGYTAVHPLGYFDEFIARNGEASGRRLHARLGPRDTVDGSRSEYDLFYARRSRTHYNDQLPLDYYRVAKLRDRYPAFAIDDITGAIDAMRVIKTQAEIAVLRRNGEISAEAVRQAMLATRSGGFEYEIEAAAMHVVLKNGAKGSAYAPIVGSGPNTCVWHYDANDRQVEQGDLVLMDFGADLDYMCMDITRTWPVSGRFTPEEREIYQLVLEVQKASIEAYRPGVTSADVQRHVAAKLKSKGLDPGDLRGGIGHYVGMATHDVGGREPLREGMVFAIEPALYFPEKNIGIRIEDTVLITKDGCEVLTRGVPKEIEEIEALLATRPPAR